MFNDLALSRISGDAATNPYLLNSEHTPCYTAFGEGDVLGVEFHAYVMTTDAHRGNCRLAGTHERVEHCVADIGEQFNAAAGEFGRERSRVTNTLC